MESRVCVKGGMGRGSRRGMGESDAAEAILWEERR
jgi:hypothetical protein